MGTSQFQDMFAAIALSFQTLTFHPGVAPLKVIIPVLAKQTGLDLHVSPDLEWCILYIRAEKAKQKDLLDEIARASQGVWTVSQRRFTLERDQGFIYKFNKQNIADRRQKLKEGYEQNRRNPDLSQQFAAAVVESVGLDRLAALPVGRQFVFSTRPSGIRLPLGSLPEAFARNLLRSTNQTRAQSAARLQAGQRDFEERQMQLPPAMAALERRSRGFDRTEILPDLPSLAILEYMNQDRPRAVMRFFGADGMPEITLNSLDFILRSQQSAETPPIKARFDSEYPIQMASGGLTSQELKRGTDRARKEILAMGEKDRLLEMMGAFYDSITSVIPGNIVMAVPDETIGYASPGYSKGKMLSSIYRRLLVTERGDWTVLSPSAPYRSLNRDLLGEALNRLASKKRSLEDWACVSANVERIGDQADYILATLLGCLRIDQSVFYQRAPGQQSLLKIYGLMTPEQQEGMRAGKAVRVSEFTPEQKRLLTQIGTNSTGYVESAVAEIRFKSDPTPEEQFKLRVALMDSRFYQNQITVQMPDGYPRNGALRLTIVNGSEYNFRLDAGYYQASERYFLPSTPK